MRLSASDWENYISRMSKISKVAADKMQIYVDSVGVADMDLIVEYAYALSTKYGEAAAALACEMYDGVAAASGLSLPAAVPAETATYGETAKAVHGTAKTSTSSIPQTVGRLVKQAGADTTLKNAQRDGAEFAWIARGDTCAFCIALSSRGWQRMSKKALKNGHAEHIHSNCDCEYAIRFDSTSSVGGYDPHKFLQMYEGADGRKPQDKINALRRRFYSQNREEINEQKRAAYAKRAEEKNNE